MPSKSVPGAWPEQPSPSAFLTACGILRRSGNGAHHIAETQPAPSKHSEPHREEGMLLVAACPRLGAIKRAVINLQKQSRLVAQLPRVPSPKARNSGPTWRWISPQSSGTWQATCLTRPEHARAASQNGHWWQEPRLPPVIVCQVCLT